MSDKDKKLESHFGDLWAGNKPLATTFWGYYVLVWILITLFGSMLAGLMDTPSQILSTAWSAFMIVPIWRASNKYQGPSSFSVLAKIFVVLLALNVLLTVIARI